MKKVFLISAVFSIWIMIELTSCKKEEGAIPAVNDNSAGDADYQNASGWPNGMVDTSELDSLK